MSVVVLATATTGDTRPLVVDDILPDHRRSATFYDDHGWLLMRRIQTASSSCSAPDGSLIVSMGLCKKTPVRAVLMHAMVNVALTIWLVISSLIKSVSMEAATVLWLALMQLKLTWCLLAALELPHVVMLAFIMLLMLVEWW
jgi:hypothetical protein